MSFYLQLREKLKKLDSKELDLLPRSYQVLGKIMLIKLDKKSGAAFCGPDIVINLLNRRKT